MTPGFAGRFCVAILNLNLLYKAYLDARRHKRWTTSQLHFEIDLERNLLNLYDELVNRTYQVSPSTCFISEFPVKREIVAPAFRDRVVHHLLFNWLEPIFERLLIYDCYSCRKGKGTHFGIDRAQKFSRAVSENFHKEAWILKLDISGFFMAIDRQRLRNFIANALEKMQYAKIDDPCLCNFILDKVVYNEPLQNVIYRSPRFMWNDLPHNKSLLYSSPGCGLPIGNITSQLFGNVYLNSLDHFVKRKLRIKYYGRYVDDFFLMHQNKDILLSAKEEIQNFLQLKLGLTLHPTKWTLRQVTKGFQFLGAYILPWRVYPNRRVESAFWDCLKNENWDLASINSYVGYFRHFNCKNRLNKMLAHLEDECLKD